MLARISKDKFFKIVRVANEKKEFLKKLADCAEDSSCYELPLKRVLEFLERVKKEKPPHLLCISLYALEQLMKKADRDVVVVELLLLDAKELGDVIDMANPELRPLVSEKLMSDAISTSFLAMASLSRVMNSCREWKPLLDSYLKDLSEEQQIVFLYALLKWPMDFFYRKPTITFLLPYMYDNIGLRDVVTELAELKILVTPEDVEKVDTSLYHT